MLAGGGELPYDLFLGIPKHRVPDVVEAAGMCVDGWIPVNPVTLETKYADVYAVGDVTSVGTPKAGVFAEGQAAVVADAIIERVHNHTPSAAYDGKGICYLEFGHDEVARVEVTFAAGETPHGNFDAASHAIAADKVRFGNERIQRWFGRDWAAT
jgi:sulfide:quinone oxidoreductase